MATKKRKATPRYGHIFVRTQDALDRIVNLVRDGDRAVADMRVKNVQAVSAEDAERFRGYIRNDLVERLQGLYAQIAAKDATIASATTMLEGVNLMRRSLRMQDLVLNHENPPGSTARSRERAEDVVDMAIDNAKRNVVRARMQDVEAEVSTSNALEGREESIVCTYSIGKAVDDAAEHWKAKASGGFKHAIDD